MCRDIADLVNIGAHAPKAILQFDLIIQMHYPITEILQLHVVDAFGLDDAVVALKELLAKANVISQNMSGSGIAGQEVASDSPQKIFSQLEPKPVGI